MNHCEHDSELALGAVLKFLRKLVMDESVCKIWRLSYKGLG